MLTSGPAPRDVFVIPVGRSPADQAEGWSSLFRLKRGIQDTLVFYSLSTSPGHCDLPASCRNGHIAKSHEVVKE